MIDVVLTFSMIATVWFRMDDRVLSWTGELRLDHRHVNLALAGGRTVGTRLSVAVTQSEADSDDDDELEDT